MQRKGLNNPPPPNLNYQSNIYEIFMIFRYLNLSQNKLEKFPEEENSSHGDDKNFKYNLPVLEELCCQNNRLECIPEQIFRLPALVILDVSNNKLKSLPSNMWSAPLLKELNASFNLLKDLPASLEVYENVSYLYCNCLT